MNVTHVLVSSVTDLQVIIHLYQHIIAHIQTSVKYKYKDRYNLLNVE